MSTWAMPPDARGFVVICLACAAAAVFILIGSPQ